MRSSLVGSEMCIRDSTQASARAHTHTHTYTRTRTHARTHTLVFSMVWSLILNTYIMEALSSTSQDSNCPVVEVHGESRLVGDDLQGPLLSCPWQITWRPGQTRNTTACSEVSPARRHGLGQTRNTTACSEMSPARRHGDQARPEILQHVVKCLRPDDMETRPDQKYYSR